MTPEVATTALSSALSLLGIIVLLFWLYRGYRIDSFRQQMFAIRDELFDFAGEGGVRFDDQAYGMLRDTMNGFIRFGHRLSLLHVLLFAATARSAAFRSEDTSFETRWNAATDALPEESQATLESFRHRMDHLVVRHVILNSPLLLAMVIPALIGLFLAEVCATWLARTFRAELDEIDTAALAYGEI